MIDTVYLGKTLDQVPEREFVSGFDDPSLIDQRFPGLVLASTSKIPLLANEWFLAYQDCGGFSCNSQYAAILPLEINSTVINALKRVVDEEFAGEGGLSYFGVYENELKVKIKNQYLDVLSQMGLTCADDLLDSLTQALYPIDATIDNLRLLSTTEVNLDELNNIKGLVIYIVGENCD